MNKLNLIGQKYGHLLVIDEAGYSEGVKRRPLWKCLCDCGNIHYSTTLCLRSGDTTSCGCEKAKRIGNSRRTHGESQTPLYKIWKGMRRRCNSPSEPAYIHYGNRGIKVCPEWNNTENGYINFKNWSLENGYADGLTIDRINNDGNYEPSNCRWTNMLTQVRNRSNTRKVEFKGEVITVKELSERFGIDYYNLYDRIFKFHMTVEDSVNDLLNR